MSSFRSRLVFVKKLHQSLKVRIFFSLKIWLNGYKKFLYFVIISKIVSYVCDKMHLKVDISKKQRIFGFAIFLKKIAVLGNNSLEVHFVTKLRPYFWNLNKIANFFTPIMAYLEREKNSDLIKWLWSNFFLSQKQASSGNYSKKWKTPFLF